MRSRSWNMELQDGYIAALYVLLAVLVIGMAAVAFLRADTDRRCLEAGWRSGHVTWTLDRYCSREENEYEIVRPLADVLQGAGQGGE